MLYFGSAAATIQAGHLEPRQMAVVESLLTAQKGRTGMLLLKMYWKFQKWDKEQCQLTCVSTRGEGLCKQTSNNDSSLFIVTLYWHVPSNMAFMIWMRWLNVLCDVFTLPEIQPWPYANFSIWSVWTFYEPDVYLQIFFGSNSSCA